jgi:hypothetical protein
VTLIIATIHPGGEVITGNLRAPLILDAATRRGAQLALDDDRLSTRQEIDYLKFGLAVAVDSAENADQESEAAAGNPGSGTGETVVARDAAVAESVASGL